VLGGGAPELADGAKAYGARHSRLSHCAQTVRQLGPHNGDCAGARRAIHQGAIEKYEAVQGLEPMKVCQLARVGGICSFGPGVCYIKDPHALQLKKGTVIGATQLAVQDAAHCASFADKDRPMLYRRELESCLVRAAAGERAANLEASGMIGRKTRLALVVIVEPEASTREATSECGIALRERPAAAPACCQLLVACAVVRRAGYVGPTDLWKDWGERGREGGCTERPLG
jgi:hypothetical protein